MPKAETCEGTIEIGGIPPTTRPGYKPYFRDVSLRCARCLGPGGFAVMSIGGDSPDEVSDSAALDAGRGLARKDCKKFTGPGIMPDSFLPTRVEIWTPKRAAKIEGLLSALVANGVGLQKESVLRGLSKPEPASYLVYVGKDERSGSEQVPRTGPLRMQKRNPARSRERASLSKNRKSSPQRRPLLPVRHRHRALSFRSMVREDEAPR